MKERNIRWFEKPFTQETANKFLQECSDYSTEFILNHAQEISMDWPLTTTLPSNEFEFNPKGAIIHISESPSMWNSLHMYTKHIHGTHLMIMSGQQSYMNDLRQYPLLKEIPSTVLMLYPLDQIVPHSGYISTETWGIDLRNAGRLRPVEQLTDPMPIMPSEENDDHFKSTNNLLHDCYWRQDLWRLPFPGPIARWENYYYECPTINQITSLIAILRVMDCINPNFDKRYVLPSNCINGSYPKLPVFHWNEIRRLMQDREYINPDLEIIKLLSRLPCEFEGCDLDWEDESFLAEQMDLTRWRGERDDGKLSILNENRQFMLANGYKRDFELLGYDSSDNNFNTLLWSISKELGNNSDADIYNLLNIESSFIK